MVTKINYSCPQVCFANLTIKGVIFLKFMT